MYYNLQSGPHQVLQPSNDEYENLVKHFYSINLQWFTNETSRAIVSMFAITCQSTGSPVVMHLSFYKKVRNQFLAAAQMTSDLGLGA